MSSSEEAIKLSLRMCELVGAEPTDPELAYINAADAARAAARLSATDPDALKPLLDLAESVLDGSDRELRLLVVIGLFEDLQNYLDGGGPIGDEEIDRRRRDAGELTDTEAVVTRLGPVSQRFWVDLYQYWAGDRQALVDL